LHSLYLSHPPHSRLHPLSLHDALPISGRRAYAILPDREKPGRIYATTINTATGGGYFYVSNDDGETWQLSARNMPNRLIAYSILQDRKDGNTIYLGTNYGLYRSTDRGTTWSPVTAPKPKPPA